MIKPSAAGPAFQMPFKGNKRRALLSGVGKVNSARPTMQQKEEARLRLLSLSAKIEAEKVVSEMAQEGVTLP